MWLKRLFCKHNLLTFKYSCCGPSIIKDGVNKVPVTYHYKCNKCGKILKYVDLVDEVPQK